MCPRLALGSRMGVDPLLDDFERGLRPLGFVWTRLGAMSFAGAVSSMQPPYASVLLAEPPALPRPCRDLLLVLGHLALDFDLNLPLLSSSSA